MDDNVERTMEVAFTVQVRHNDSGALIAIPLFGRVLQADVDELSAGSELARLAQAIVDLNAVRCAEHGGAVAKMIGLVRTEDGRWRAYSQRCCSSVGPVIQACLHEVFSDRIS